MTASQIRAASGEDADAVVAYAEQDAAKAERGQAAAERVAAYEAEHGKLRPIRKGRR